MIYIIAYLVIAGCVAGGFLAFKTRDQKNPIDEQDIAEGLGFGLIWFISIPCCIFYYLIKSFLV